MCEKEIWAFFRNVYLNELEKDLTFDALLLFQLVVKNIDDLFNWPEFSAVLDMGGVFNTGVFVAEPANETFHDMLNVTPIPHFVPFSISSP